MSDITLKQVTDAAAIWSKYSFLDSVYSRLHANQLSQLIENVKKDHVSPEVLRWYISGEGKEDRQYVGTKSSYQLLHNDLYDYVRSRLKDTAIGENGKIYDDSIEIFENLTRELTQIEQDARTSDDLVNLAYVYLGKLEDLFLKVEMIQVIGNPQAVIDTLDHFQQKQQETLTKLEAVLTTEPSEDGLYETAPGRKFTREYLESLIAECKRKIESYNNSRNYAGQVQKDIGRLILGEDDNK